MPETDIPSTRSDVARVAIVEDRPEIREGLVLLVGRAEGFEVAGAWGSAEEALPRLLAAAPSVVLMDLGLPGMDGIEAIRRLHRRHPDLPVVVLSVYDDDRRIFEALCAGAVGYLLKKTPRERLLGAIEEVLAGGSPISPEIAKRVVHLFREFRPPSAADFALTPHDLRLLRLLADGHHYKTVADELGVTVSTVGYHLQKIYRKLQVHSKSEAVVKAVRERLV